MNTVVTILVTVLIFGLLIFIHELGHYIAARAFGVGIKEFAIGMGPKLFSRRGNMQTTARKTWTKPTAAKHR